MIAKTLKLFVTLKAGTGVLSFIGDRNVDNLLDSIKIDSSSQEQYLLNMGLDFGKTLCSSHRVINCICFLKLKNV